MMNRYDVIKQRELYSKPIEVGNGFAVRVLTARNRHFNILDGVEIPGKIMLDIDPGYSFGEGTHPTTQLCAEALERWVRPGTAVLDIGCGTGILSVLAARLGADRVTAADISPEAVKAARHNAALNGVQDKVFVLESDLAQAVDGRFDLAAANILADPLLRLLEQEDGFLRTDGTLILSGIREGRMEEVETAAKRRFDIAEKELRDGWGLLVLRLKSGEEREGAV